MPLAIIAQVKDLPVEFRSTNHGDVAGGSSCPNYPDVIIGARVSKSGQGDAAKPGDLQGRSSPVKVGASGVAVVIDKLAGLNSGARCRVCDRSRRFRLALTRRTRHTLILAA